MAVRRIRYVSISRKRGAHFREPNRGYQNSKQIIPLYNNVFFFVNAIKIIDNVVEKLSTKGSNNDFTIYGSSPTPQR